MRKATRLLLIHVLVATALLGAHANAQSDAQAEADTTITKPNILLLLPDQWRFDWDGRDSDNKLDLLLPHFTQLAQRGTRFLHAYSPSPLCGPSRACLASGREYDQAGVPTNFANDYDVDNIPTFYSLLRDQAGYHTMTVGKDDLTKATHLGTTIGHDGFTGLYHQHELGFSDGRRCGGKMDVVSQGKPFEMYGHWLQQQHAKLANGTAINGWDAHYWCIMHSKECTKELFRDDWYEDTWIAQQAMELLSTGPPKPWFLQVNFAGPHPPFLVTPKQRQAVEQRTFPAAVDNSASRPETCAPVDRPQSSNRDRCDYAAELEHLDALVGQILEQIDIDTTIVCFTSDHGEMLGDHGLVGKKKPWQGSVSVPLACAGPGIQPGATMETPFVSTLDLAATFLDYAGIDKLHNEDHPQKMTSQSLKPILETGTDPNYRQVVSSGMQSYPFGEYYPQNGHYYSWRMVVESRTGLKYVCCRGHRCPQHSKKYAPDGVYQFLFNTTNDPFDLVPLNEKLPQEMKRLRAFLPKDFPCDPSKEDIVALQ